MIDSVSAEHDIIISVVDTALPRGGHSHTRNTFGRDRGHRAVTGTRTILLVVTGSQDISGSGHGVTRYFL